MVHCDHGATVAGQCDSIAVPPHISVPNLAFTALQTGFLVTNNCISDQPCR
jgi:hypothetical protein